MEIKKTKLVRDSLLNKNKKFRVSRVMKLRQEKFKMIMKIGNTTGIIHSELCRLTKKERRQWFEEELERGNPVLLDIQRAVRESYIKRMQSGDVE
jgi:mRNA-degrading endonuclease RelE of RelBE toxin-antitoxin system